MDSSTDPVQPHDAGDIRRANLNGSGSTTLVSGLTSNLAPTGSLLTSSDGEGKLDIPTSPVRVYIPYLGINMPLTNFPQRELHSLWLPPVKLPDRVP